VVYQRSIIIGSVIAKMSRTLPLLLLLMSASLSAQERTVDATWLHRYLPELSETKVELSSASCHYKPIFGTGDPDSRILRSVSRFGEVTVDAHGNCQEVLFDREEAIYFVLQGTGNLKFGDGMHPLRANDFTYLAPGVKHGFSNDSSQSMRVLRMSFKVPLSRPLSAPSQPKIVNMDDVKEETVQGHPTSVLYKLLVGPHDGKRDAIDAASVVTSFFLMDFAPGGTNFPHHHETAEEIYLVVSGEGEMVAGSGMNGLEARFPAKAGDAYYFRANCTVGFYNQDKPGAKAYILAVRSQIPLADEKD
jgi:mannose-6-phosphate isomerase-like protein (cupin superfamily)